MGNFQGGDRREGGFRGGNSGGRPSFGKKFGGDRGGDRSDTQMFKATCSECGKSCDVPFRPNGEKPVFCSDCFSAKREGGQGGDRGPKRDFGNKFDNKFEKRAPQKSFGDRPSFAKPAGDNGDTKRVLAEISSKLDRLISAMEKSGGSKSVSTSVAKTEVKKTPSLSAVVKKAVATKAPAKKVAKVATKKVVAKKKK